MSTCNRAGPGMGPGMEMGMRTGGVSPRITPVASWRLCYDHLGSALAKLKGRLDWARDRSHRLWLLVIVDVSETCCLRKLSCIKI